MMLFRERLRAWKGAADVLDFERRGPGHSSGDGEAEGQVLVEGLAVEGRTTVAADPVDRAHEMPEEDVAERRASPQQARDRIVILRVEHRPDVADDGVVHAAAGGFRRIAGRPQVEVDAVRDPAVRAAAHAPQVATQYEVEGAKRGGGLGHGANSAGLGATRSYYTHDSTSRTRSSTATFRCVPRFSLLAA